MLKNILVLGCAVLLIGGCGKVVEEPVLPPAAALAPVTSIQVSATASTALLTWEAVPGAATYYLYWSNTPGITKYNAMRIAGVTSPYTHTSLVNGKSYYYTVTAAGLISPESEVSVEVSAQPQIKGELDTAFNSTGKIVISNAAGGNGDDMVLSTAVDGDGKIVVTGGSMNAAANYDLVVWRYNADGTPDTSFGTNGVFIYRDGSAPVANEIGYGVAIDRSGRIVVTGGITGTGGDLAVWRLKSNGTLDTSFNGSGLFSWNNSKLNDSDLGFGVAIDDRNRIVVCGSTVDHTTTSDLAVWRLNDSGLDTTFKGGVVICRDTAGGSGADVGRGVTIDNTGRILVTGASENAALNSDMVTWAFLSNGEFDGSFGSGGVVISNNTAGGNGDDSGLAIMVDRSNRVLVAGNSENSSHNDSLVVWYGLANGTADPAFGAGNSFVVYSNLAGGTGDNVAYGIGQDQAGKYVVSGFGKIAAGDQAIVALRLNSDGTKDTSFGNNGVFTSVNTAGGTGNNLVLSQAIDNQGRLILAGFGQGSTGNIDGLLLRLK